MTIKIASYNIHFGVGQDAQYDLERISNAVAGQDIICLQEVTRHWPASQLEDQPERLALMLNMYSAYAAGFEIDRSQVGTKGQIENARSQFGNMVLSRWPILYSRSHSLPRPYCKIEKDYLWKVDFPRVALETVIDCHGVPLRVFSIHLSHLPGPHRQVQTDTLRELLSSLPTESILRKDDFPLLGMTGVERDIPVPQGSLLLGDFNFCLDDEDYNYVVAPQNTGRTSLFDGWRLPEMRGVDRTTCVEGDDRLIIDFLFVTEMFSASIKSAYADQTILASDHFPMFFELEV